MVAVKLAPLDFPALVGNNLAARQIHLVHKPTHPVHLVETNRVTHSEIRTLVVVSLGRTSLQVGVCSELTPRPPNLLAGCLEPRIIPTPASVASAISNKSSPRLVSRSVVPPTQALGLGLGVLLLAQAILAILEVACSATIRPLLSDNRTSRALPPHSVDLGRTSRIKISQTPIQALDSDRTISKSPAVSSGIPIQAIPVAACSAIVRTISNNSLRAVFLVTITASSNRVEVHCSGQNQRPLVVLFLGIVSRAQPILILGAACLAVQMQIKISKIKEVVFLGAIISNSKSQEGFLAMRDPQVVACSATTIQLNNSPLVVRSLGRHQVLITSSNSPEDCSALQTT